MPPACCAPLLLTLAAAAAGMKCSETASSALVLHMSQFFANLAPLSIHATLHLRSSRQSCWSGGTSCTMCATRSTGWRLWACR